MEQKKYLEPLDTNILKDIFKEIKNKPPVPVEEQNKKLAELLRQLRN